MKTRLGLLMVLALLAALSTTLAIRADGPAVSGDMGAEGRQTGALPSILPVSSPRQPAANVAASARLPAGQEVGPLEGDRQPALWKPAAPQAANATYSVEWNITASGQSDTQGSECSKRKTRQITISGYAVYHQPAQGPSSTIPMNLIITDDMYEAVRCEDSGYDEWTSIADPHRYTGGPDPWWSGYAAFSPYQAPDGTWSMANPFVDWTFVVSGELARYYDYRTDLEWYDEDDRGSSSHTEEWTHYADILRALKDMPLIGDETGTVFKLATAYTVETSDLPLAVHFDATVSGAGCTGLGAPIDVANPNLKFVDLNLQAGNTTPDREATLQARVTCQGVPVINAPVVVTLRVKERSGGHNHSDRKRPRGYIDGVEQDADTKFTGLTDGDGAVTFAIAPGRDLTDKSRGIAGLYFVDARVEYEGLTSPKKRAYINARLDLVPLPEGPLYTLARFFESHHPEQFHGTRATVERVQELASYWINIQNLQNEALKKRGRDPWPVDYLQIGGLSLPQGGLFDWKAPFPNQMWRVPLGQHRFGVDVALQSPSLELVEDPPICDLWLGREFRNLGNQYGTWFREPGHPFKQLIPIAYPRAVCCQPHGQECRARKPAEASRSAQQTALPATRSRKSVWPFDRQLV